MKFLLMLSIVVLCLAFFASAQPQYVVSMNGANWDEGVLFSSLQGLMNRAAPRVFLDWDGDCTRWLKWDEQRFGAHPVKLDNRWKLLEYAKPYAKGYVLWDSSEPDQANVACTLAGLRDLLPVATSLEAKVQKYGYKCVLDLPAVLGHKDRLSIYKWAFEHIKGWNHTYVCNLTVPAPVVFDATPYVHKGKLLLRFGDETPEDGLGAKLSSLRLYLAGSHHPFLSFMVGTPEEASYLVDEKDSWFDPEGDRIADRDQYFTYQLPVPAGSSCRVVLTIQNGYLVEAQDAEGNWHTLAKGPLVERDGRLQPLIGPSPDNKPRDFVVAERGFFFNLSADSDHWPKEAALRREILESLDKPGWVLGWHTKRDSEGWHVHQASVTGNFVICSGAPNFSWHQHFRPASLPAPKIAPAPPLQQDKVYVSFLLSDGDALWCLYSFQQRHWLKKSRGKVPFGWEIQPLLVKLAPDILTYYVETATPQDALIGAFGAGYNHPNLMRPRDLQRYLEFTRKVDEETHFHYISLLADGAASWPLALAYQRVCYPQIKGVLEGYAATGGDDLPLSKLIWLKSRLPNGDGSEAGVLKQLNQYADSVKQRPLFVSVHIPLGCEIRSPDVVADLVKKLDSRFVVVRPDQLLELARAWYSAHPLVQVPGRCFVSAQVNLANTLVLRNTTPSPRKFTFALQPGKCLPATVEAAPDALLQPRLVPPLNASKVELSIMSPGLPTLQATLPVSVLPPVAGLERNKTLVVLREFPMADLSHRFGQPVEAAGTWSKQAWYTGKAPHPTSHVCFGPYFPVPPGKYVALFRLQAHNTPQAAPGKLDVYSGEELAAHELTASETPPGKWVYFALPFTIKHRRAVEFRFELHDTTSEFYCDEVLLLEVQN